LAGDKTSCVVDRSSSSFTFTHNITGDLSTCDPVGLAITGGVSPYTVSLIAANSPAVTNVTMPEGDNVYTYISRAAPGGQLVGASPQFLPWVVELINDFFHTTIVAVSDA
jgi:hypothetical protein